MKKIVEVVEVEGEGLVSLMGQRVTFMCGVYFYTGKLVGVNDACVELEDAGIVYETGPFDTKIWKDMQKLPNNWFVQIASIESFGVLK